MAELGKQSRFLVISMSVTTVLLSGYTVVFKNYSKEALVKQP